MIWKTYKLGDLVDNFSIRAKDNGGASNLNFLGVSNEDGITESKYAAEDKAEEYKIIELGCFAYNPYRINVGSIALMDKDIKGLISPAYVVFKPKPKSIIPELLLKFLKSSEGLRQIKLYARGTVRQALRFEDLCKIEIRLPDYDDQLILFKNLNITHNEGDKFIFQHSHQLDLLKNLRKQILQTAIQGKLVPQDPNDEPAIKLLESIRAEKEQLIKKKKIKKGSTLQKIRPEELPFEIPENWVWCRLGDIVLSMTNGIYKEDKFYNETGIGCLRMYNIKDGSINFHNLKHMIITDKELLTYALEENDILLNRVNSIELLGKAGLIEKLEEPLIFESKNIRLRLFKKESLAGYLNYVFQLQFIKNQIYHSFKKVTGQASISQEKLNPLLIPLPPANEQLRIVSKIKQLMKLCDDLEQSIQQNLKYSQELLQVALKEALEPK